MGKADSVSRAHCFGLVLALVCSGQMWAAVATRAPAMVVYDRVQAMRDSADALLQAGHDSEHVHQAIAVLNDALAVLDQPESEDFADGNLYLRFRRYDAELDLAQAYALLGDKASALDHLDRAARVGSLDDPAGQLIANRPGLAVLQSEPRFQRMVQATAAMQRIWSHPDLATQFSQTLTPEQRIAGLSLFWSEANYNFVYFDHVPELNWDKTYLEFLPQVLAAKTTHDYYDVLMRLAPLLHDGHTTISPPEQIADEFYARPPLRTELIDGHVYVSEVWSPWLARHGIGVGDEILAIDGEPVRDYAERHVRPYVSSSTPQDAGVRMYTYALLAGDVTKPVTLRLRDARARERTIDVGRSHYDDVRRPAQAAFRMLRNEVAYLDVDQFVTDATVKAFEAALPQILKSKALILDVRNNGGGSSRYGRRILGYLSATALPETVSRERDYAPVFRAHGGTALQWKTLERATDAEHHDQIFTGKVAVLIGPRTFSAAEDFVASFDLMHRGSLVGTATGGSTGQPLQLKLPGGGTARICVKRDEYPEGREFVGKGIAPDVDVRQTIEDLRAGRDAVLERAISEVTKVSVSAGRSGQN